MFHVRLRTALDQVVPLTAPELAPQILKAVQRYHELAHWWCQLVVVMPDHLHALLSFPADAAMAATVRDWKRGTARFQSVRWQTNFFDHRIRTTAERDKTWIYMLNNPVAKGLVARPEEWPWQWTAGGTR